jgi:hypothetical protein
MSTNSLMHDVWIAVSSAEFKSIAIKDSLEPNAVAMSAGSCKPGVAQPSSKIKALLCTECTACSRVHKLRTMI